MLVMLVMLVTHFQYNPLYCCDWPQTSHTYVMMRSPEQHHKQEPPDCGLCMAPIGAIVVQCAFVNEQPVLLQGLSHAASSFPQQKVCVLVHVVGALQQSCHSLREAGCSCWRWYCSSNTLVSSTELHEGHR